MESMPALKEYSELKVFSDAQTKTIIELSRKLNEKDKEVIHLKKLLEGSVPLIRNKKDTSKFEANDQEYICRTEINKLRDISIERELTLEEARKFELYCKVLKDMLNAPKVIEVQSRTMTTEDLLKGIEEG